MCAPCSVGSVSSLPLIDHPCGVKSFRTAVRFNTNVVRLSCALDGRAPSVGGIRAGWVAPPSVARGAPTPLLAPPRSLWSRPRRVAGASGDRLSGFALPFFIGWRHRGCPWRLVAWLPRPRGVVCSYSRALWDCSPCGSQSQRTRPCRAPTPLASVAFSLLSPAPPFSPPMAPASICDNSISRDKIYRAILYRTKNDFVFEIKLTNTCTNVGSAAHTKIMFAGAPPPLPRPHRGTPCPTRGGYGVYGVGGWGSPPLACRPLSRCVRVKIRNGR